MNTYNRCSSRRGREEEGPPTAQQYACSLSRQVRSAEKSLGKKKALEGLEEELKKKKPPFSYRGWKKVLFFAGVALSLPLAPRRPETPPPRFSGSVNKVGIAGKGKNKLVTGIMPEKDDWGREARQGMATAGRLL